MKLNEIPIPERLMLHGQVVAVIKDKLLMTQQGNRGECRYDYNEIRLQPETEGVPTPRGKLEQSFFHELYHQILFHAGADELAKNEEHVDLVSNLLHQAFATAEYGRKS